MNWMRLNSFFFFLNQNKNGGKSSRQEADPGTAPHSALCLAALVVLQTSALRRLRQEALPTLQERVAPLAALVYLCPASGHILLIARVFLPGGELLKGRALSKGHCMARAQHRAWCVADLNQ